jgi:hypothetical protein
MQYQFLIFIKYINEHLNLNFFKLMQSINKKNNNKNELFNK